MKINLFKVFIIKFRSLVEKATHVFKIRFFYSESSGIKAMNCRHICPSNLKIDDLPIVSVDRKNLYLGLDFLKDNYSFIDTPLTESPHYKLMRDLSEQKPIERSEYINLLCKGRLDERREINLFDIDFKKMHSLFEARRADIKANSYNPILVFKANTGKYYIVDGKHRAALASLYFDSLNCVAIDFRVFYSFIDKKLLKTISGKKHYTRHDAFLKSNADDANII